MKKNTHKLESPDPDCEYCQAVPCQIVYSIGEGNTAVAMVNGIRQVNKADNQIDLDKFKDILLSPLTTYDYFWKVMNLCLILMIFDGNNRKTFNYTKFTNLGFIMNPFYA